MLQSLRNSRRLCNLLVDQLGKRYQSVATATAQTDLSKASILSGHIKGDITNRLEFIRPEQYTPIPIYQVLDSEGNVKDKSQIPDVSIIILKIESPG